MLNDECNINQNKEIFLTFDMDWANDGVLQDFYELLIRQDVIGTIHVTHDTKMLKVFRKDSDRFELGIHPNFEKILKGMDSRTSEEVVNDIINVVPEAICTRSHSLTNGSRLKELYYKCGIKYDLNLFVDVGQNENLCIKPYTSVFGTIDIPFIFEDDLYFMSNIKKDVDFYLGNTFMAKRVFNFHPINLFLNTDCLDTYEKAKEDFQNYEKLKKYVNKEKYGARDFFVDLCTISKKLGYSFKRICDMYEE